MRRWLALLTVALAGLAGVVVLSASLLGDDAPRTAGDEASCPAPRVTALKARWGGERGQRIKLRVHADPGDGRMIAIDPAWGDGTTTIYDLAPTGRRSWEFAHHYRETGTYRVSVVAESISRGCGLMKSSPSTLSIRVPVPPAESDHRGCGCFAIEASGAHLTQGLMAVGQAADTATSPNSRTCSRSP